MSSIYLIGSLRNEKIPQIGNLLRDNGWDAFDDWYGAGHEADDKWRDYEQFRGRDLRTSVYGYAARHVFAFDKYHLDRCDYACLVMPAGRSGHLELGYFIGQGKPGYILLDGIPERYDVMWNFAKDIFTDEQALLAGLNSDRDRKTTAVDAPKGKGNTGTTVRTYSGLFTEKDARFDIGEKLG